MERDDDNGGVPRDLAERSRLRRARLVAHRSASHAEAEAWYLEFWQSRSPEDRLTAFASIRRDVALVIASRKDEED